MGKLISERAQIEEAFKLSFRGGGIITGFKSEKPNTHEQGSFATCNYQCVYLFNYCGQVTARTSSSTDAKAPPFNRHVKTRQSTKFFTLKSCDMPIILTNDIRSVSLGK